MAQAEPSPSVVLVVDDEPDILSSVARWIERTVPDVRVVTAVSGAEALSILARERVDLVLSDYLMPGVDGLGLLRSARVQQPAAPRVLMTAFADERVAVRAIHEGSVERFLRKPLELGILTTTLRELLRERRREAPRPSA